MNKKVSVRLIDEYRSEKYEISIDTNSSIKELITRINNIVFNNSTIENYHIYLLRRNIIIPLRSSNTKLQYYDLEHDEVIYVELKNNNQSSLIFTFLIVYILLSYIRQEAKILSIILTLIRIFVRYTESKLPDFSSLDKNYYHLYFDNLFLIITLHLNIHYNYNEEYYFEDKISLFCLVLLVYLLSELCCLMKTNVLIERRIREETEEYLPICSEYCINYSLLAWRIVSWTSFSLLLNNPFYMLSSLLLVSITTIILVEVKLSYGKKGLLY